MNGVKTKHFSFLSRQADGLIAQGRRRQADRLYTNITPSTLIRSSSVLPAQDLPPRRPGSSRPPARRGAARSRRRGQQPRGGAKLRGAPRSAPRRGGCRQCPFKGRRPAPSTAYGGSQERSEASAFKRHIKRRKRRRAPRCRAAPLRPPGRPPLSDTHRGTDRGSKQEEGGWEEGRQK